MIFFKARHNSQSFFLNIIVTAISMMARPFPSFLSVLTQHVHLLFVTKLKGQLGARNSLNFILLVLDYSTRASSPLSYHMGFIVAIYLYFQACLDDFSHHNIDMACNLLETCDRFLYRSAETYVFKASPWRRLDVQAWERVGRRRRLD
jgi:hypothetical protein